MTHFPSSSSLKGVIDTIKSKIEADVTEYYENATLSSVKSRLLASGVEAENFVCGDVNIEDFQNILNAAGVNKGDVFYDLGCGSGNCLIACYLYESPSFSKIVGIELMKSKLIECSFVSAHLKLLPQYQHCTVDIIDCNFLLMDWSDGDVVYACATCFTNALLAELFKLFQRLKKGSRVILLDKRIPDDVCCSGRGFELTHQVTCRTTWGFGNAFIYRVI